MRKRSNLTSASSTALVIERKRLKVSSSALQNGAFLFRFDMQFPYAMQSFLSTMHCDSNLWEEFTDPVYFIATLKWFRSDINTASVKITGQCSTPAFAMGGRTISMQCSNLSFSGKQGQGSGHRALWWFLWWLECVECVCSLLHWQLLC